VDVAVEVGGNADAIKVKPKEVEKDLVYKVARQFTIDVRGYWHPRAISGTGYGCIYQEGDVTRLFAATEDSLEAVRELRAAKWSAAAIPKAGDYRMVVWVSTDSQYVRKGIIEWMPNWKRNRWKNSKKTGVVNKSLWTGLDAAIARHRPVEFSWAKAHS
jgi:ribonuclease HI